MLRSFFSLQNREVSEKTATRELSKKIGANPEEVQKAIKQLEPHLEEQLTQQIEAQILINRRDTLDKTLAEAEEQSKYTPY